ncbi:D-isomer specific 2-hydroxyacid dehydrogenase, catalytic domain [Flavobacterium fryxellicola]|uniref:D-isomer specific 2-hydroxyacid dehydrogenase catalytic domain-containing protein n=1 Tax=Flavobacterium fryxellicola TaxID=249352 RepID=A0A167WBK8_9FLAO|nr:hypothetical protein [Flavobacterium fryxellicola]OAB27202.1 hypothetical protein FBFR_11730 [Flavobacterium fryxellicola]SHN67750.1 D-isomer specific 2-hydroxyacid dehydrogenase, catalytic domain [Flavobacterium fryxellicola]
MEKAAHGNHELVFSEEHLNENTADLAKGFDAISLSLADVAAEAVLQKLYTYGAKHIALRAVLSDLIDLPRAKSLALKVPNAPTYSP